MKDLKLVVVAVACLLVGFFLGASIEPEAAGPEKVVPETGGSAESDSERQALYEARIDLMNERNMYRETAEAVRQLQMENDRLRAELDSVQDAGNKPADDKQPSPGDADSEPS